MRVRYEIKRTDAGRFLFCDEAPRLRVSIDRAHAFSEVEARELKGRVILLDGAGSFGPLLDNAAKLYNLAHHAGCQRAFTLAEPGHTRLDVFTLDGRRVRTLADRQFGAGRHSVTLRDPLLSSGVYLVHLEGPGVSEGKKLLILK